MTTLGDGAAIKALEAVRSYLVDEGRDELSGKVAEVIRALGPGDEPAPGPLLSTGEAAALLGVAVRTVQRRWQSALLKLHELLKGQWPGL